ncbi:MAG TPA: hypothetical protein VG477_02760, partial [Thermoanaerobaculia bacterium]|nr:hypothetical protein [Thermoanaerobaculia bacterium]
MKKLLLPLLLALGASALPAQQPADPSFGDAVDVTVVNIDVYVTDKAGNRVNGLRKEDFVVLEDGKPVQITNFEAVHGSSAPSPAPAAPAPPQPQETPAPPAAPANPENGLSLVVFVD